GATAKSQADEAAKLIKIGSDGLRLQRVQRVPTGAVVRFAVFSANESLHFVRERQQAEQVALLACCQTQDERRRHEAFKDRDVRTKFPAGKPRRIHDHVDFLSTLDLKNLRDRFTPPRSGFPVNFVKTVPSGVFTQLFKIAALSDLSLRM